MTRPIEHSFPSAQIDKLAEAESWRKEIYRPLYSIHKWWAKRLGTVFRAITLGATMDDEEDIWSHFYAGEGAAGRVVLDPFMGSGTSIGEAAKLGLKTIGCDINPISTFIVRQALTRIPTADLEMELEKIRIDTAPKIQRYYSTTLPDGDAAEVLHYFWVKIVETPDGAEVPLFASYVFSKDAYPKKKPAARILCSSCWDVFEDRYDTVDAQCPTCAHRFNPQVGPVTGNHVSDRFGRKHYIKDLINVNAGPPKHRLYALKALNSRDEKLYMAPTATDHEIYSEAEMTLAGLQDELPLPDMKIRSGYNTDQARGYNYENWRDFFNSRQLLCHGLLLQRIMSIKDKARREALLCLFSGNLEFNNMFCSFKGEGTGAVRHLFAHHTLKPERTPLENNIWGTGRSGGSFTSLFRSRLLKAKEYLEQPFELAANEDAEKRSFRKQPVGGPLDVQIVSEYADFTAYDNATLILNGNSARLPIPNASVDAVVTDPPYFDFIHYSELSDFFYAWLAPMLAHDYEYFASDTSGADGEVQHHDPDDFARNLGSVFEECFRVLKADGVLVFSFHHSRPEGWLSIFDAVRSSGLTFVAAHAVKAEMAVSAPKTNTRQPINLDVILVCKKVVNESPGAVSLAELARVTDAQIVELEDAGRKLSTADRRVIMAGKALVYSARRKLDRDSTKGLLTQIFDTEAQRLGSLWKTEPCASEP